MPSTAGFQLLAGRIPGERIATSTRTSNSSSFTAETQTDTVTAPLVSGRTYRVRVVLAPSSSVSGDVDLVRMREDNSSGTLLQFGRVYIGSATGYSAMLEAQYTAVATGDKTFVVTGARSSGTGNITHAAGATQPTYLYVDYISG